MFRSRWLSNLLNTTRSGNDSRRPSAQPHNGVRLRLEQLEDRVTPSGFDFNAVTLPVAPLFPAFEMPLLPAMQSSPLLAIEVQVINQLPSLQLWNTQLQQTTGMGLPGFSNLFATLDTNFPTMTNFVLSGQQ